MIVFQLRDETVPKRWINQTVFKMPKKLNNIHWCNRQMNKVITENNHNMFMMKQLTQKIEQIGNPYTEHSIDISRDTVDEFCVQY